MFLIELAIFGFLHVLVIFTNVDSFSLSFSIPTERQTFQFTHKYISFFFFSFHLNGSLLCPLYQEKNLGWILFGEVCFSFQHICFVWLMPVLDKQSKDPGG